MHQKTPLLQRGTVFFVYVSASPSILHPTLYSRVVRISWVNVGGKQRLSNFMLWQAAYAELYFIVS